MRLASTAELGSERAEVLAELVLGFGWVFNTEGASDDRRLSDVPIAFAPEERLQSEAVVGCEKAVKLGDVDPMQQMGVVRGVGPPVRGRADNTLVNTMNDVDCPLCFGGWTERCRGKKVGGALQPSPRVGPIVGVLCDAGHRKRVQ